MRLPELTVSNGNQCTEITSVAKFVQLVEQHSADPKIRFYYRGEPRTVDSHGARRLVPALLRKPTLESLRRVHGPRDPITIQAKILGRLQRYVPWSSWPEATHAGSDLAFGDRLCLAQHHGLPTLLLDWTLHPLAALYFSVTKHKKEDGRFWLMELKRASERKGCVCHLEENQPLQEHTEIPTLVVPRPFSRRIEVQAGRFIYFGHCDKPLESFSDMTGLPFTALHSWKVPSASKERIQRELGHLQVHGGTMFPGFDGYARYLSEGGL